MKNDPIDYDSPLGISKREWTKVLGVNLALLLIVYVVALVCTLCGSNLFLLRFENTNLENMEAVMRNGPINFYPLVEMAIATVEAYIIGSYVCRKLIKWYYPLSYYAAFIGMNVLLFNTFPQALQFLTFGMNVIFFSAIIIIESLRNKLKPKEWAKYIARLAIAAAISFCLNELIGLFRTMCFGIGKSDYPNSALFALSIEYDLALILALGLLTFLIKWEKGEQKWETFQDVGGSSPTSKRWSRKNSLTKNNLNPKQRRKIALLKAKVIAIQTVALAVIAALPWFAGRPVEFTLLYLSFCLTRVILGFSHSLHFKSELSCVTLGALTFWGLTFLAPSAEASIIMSLVYGAGLALGFRLYWELHDLLMYRKAAKTDRYAMFYTAFKGNLDPRHIRGVMRLRGFLDDDLIKAVQMYMAKEKVDYIAKWMNVPLRSIDRKLTETADAIYRMR